MRALSIRQPWAWAICHAGKRVENRDWQHAPSYRGPLLVHAAKGYTRAEDESAQRFILDACGKVPASSCNLARGAIVARARLVDVVRNGLTGHRWSFDAAVPWCMLCGASNAPPNEDCGNPDPWAVPGALGLILADVVPLATPVPCRGMLGFFEPSVDVLRAVEVQP